VTTNPATEPIRFAHWVPGPLAVLTEANHQLTAAR
jgi:hypothetical protein